MENKKQANAIIGETHIWLKKFGIVPKAVLTETLNSNRVIFTIDLSYIDGFQRLKFMATGVSYLSPEDAYQLALDDLAIQVLKDMEGGAHGESK